MGLDLGADDYITKPFGQPSMGRVLPSILEMDRLVSPESMAESPSVLIYALQGLAGA